jgi:hypothetical protein
MRIVLLIFTIAFWATTSALGQSRWASSVLNYQFNESQQAFGHGAEYFPANVLGSVDTGVSPTTPASTPQTVCSIGKGGYIALGFEPAIIDGPGADFTVFENVLVVQATGAIFDEWMIVSVSNDGVNWVDFPYDTLLGTGMAGRTPTAATGADYLDPSQSGGDSYDLAAIGLSQARYVRVTDATRWQDALRLAADLDAIGAIHQAPASVEPDQENELSVRQGGEWLEVTAPSSLSHIVLYDLVGKQLATAIAIDGQMARLPLFLGQAILLVAEGKRGERWIQRVCLM